MIVHGKMLFTPTLHTTAETSEQPISHPPQSASPREPGFVAPLDYAEMERSLLATEQGRWFLAEYLERNSSCETGLLLEAVARLERSLRLAEAASSEESLKANIDSLKADIMEMFNSFAQTRKEISRIRAAAGASSHSPFTRYAFAEITETMEHSTHAVLEAAEDIQSAVQSLRDKGGSERYYIAIERQLAQIHRACAMHDHSLRRNVKVVELLGHLESELMAIIESWERDAEETEALASENPEAKPAPLQRQLVENLALSILSETQKQALFT